jgi:hypothetical protein
MGIFTVDDKSPYRMGRGDYAAELIAISPYKIRCTILRSYEELRAAPGILVKTAHAKAGGH